MASEKPKLYAFKVVFIIPSSNREMRFINDFVSKTGGNLQVTYDETSSPFRLEPQFLNTYIYLEFIATHFPQDLMKQMLVEDFVDINVSRSDIPGR